ncbi:MAG: bacteriophage holin [Chlamydiales bacterium]|nr:bacteriophage holin [Chlamydiales bacterium]
MLKPVKLGIAAGIVWGVCMFISTILAIYTGYFEQFLRLMAGIYPGFDISWIGAFLGLIYGFIDAGIGFFLIAWIYNKLNKQK